MSKNILVLVGSPRKKGNTQKLVDAFIDGAEKSGNQITSIRAADKNISGCLGCNHCFTSGGVCIQKDDMAEVLEAYKAADLVAFASPIYYWGITAQLKLLLDRTYALLPLGRSNKEIALLLTCGDEDLATVDPTLDTFNKMIQFTGWKLLGTVVATGFTDTAWTDDRLELTQAYELGNSI